MTNAPALSTTERNRLVAILGRLGSDFDGERASAALLASRLLRDRNLTWDDVVAAGGSTRPEPSWTAGASAEQGDLVVCLRWLGELSAWEVGFVTDLRRKRRPLTPAQAVKLVQIADALRARGLT